MRKFLVLSLISMISPVFVYAGDIHVTNNTDVYTSAKLGSSPCSGDKGAVLKPHDTAKIPESVIFTFCGLSSCKAKVYMNSDCKGNPTGEVTVKTSGGIRDIKNLDPKHFILSGSGSRGAIDPVHGEEENSVKQFFKSLF